jgi:hypothetical protein
MRGPRQLEENAWYKVRTQINVGEPVFKLEWVKTLFHKVLFEAAKRFCFEMYGLVLDGDWLMFCIKPADGRELPDIIKWIKQTFAVRFNFRTGRKGHVWGDRYSSEIIADEPPPEAKAVDWDEEEALGKKKIPAAIPYALTWDSPRWAGLGSETCFPLQFAFASKPLPG